MLRKNFEIIQTEKKQKREDSKGSPEFWTG